MRAVLCPRLEGPEALELATLEPPTPRPGEVTIDVKAAALNFADLLMTRGSYQEKPPVPFVPGMELAGTIRAVGDGVGELEVGKRVLAVVNHGGFAEVVRARAADVLPIGGVMGFDMAAGFPIAYGTAHGALAWRGQIEVGETLLVHGAAGGVGLTAVEVGRAMGAKVIATARGAERLELAREYGAWATIDTSSEDVRDRVLELTHGRGVDVCFDPVGGELGNASLRTLTWEGRYLVIGSAAGTPTEIRANYLLVKNIAAVGFYWGSYRHFDPRRLRASLETLLAWARAGKLRPHISARFALEDVKQALDALKDRKTTGKVVLEIG